MSCTKRLIIRRRTSATTRDPPSVAVPGASVRSTDGRRSRAVLTGSAFDRRVVPVGGPARRRQGWAQRGAANRRIGLSATIGASADSHRYEGGSGSVDDGDADGGATRVASRSECYPTGVVPPASQRRQVSSSSLSYHQRPAESGVVFVVVVVPPASEHSRRSRRSTQRTVGSRLSHSISSTIAGRAAWV